MNEMLQRLETAADRQRQFVGDASHELRSPLAALRAQVDVALAHSYESNSQLTLESVQRQAGRMSTLIDDLLFLAHRAENNPGNPGSVIDLDELVLTEVHRLRSLSGAAVELTGIRAARIDGSERDIARMLRNLGDNAHEHASGLVTVELAVTGTTAEIRVTDDGPGIPANNRVASFTDSHVSTNPADARRQEAVPGSVSRSLARSPSTTTAA